MSSPVSLALQKITTWPELGINYWGIHKNASTTLTQHFLNLVGEKFDNEKHAKNVVRSRLISRHDALNNNLKNFCVVRNPIDRFLSTYFMFKYPKNSMQEKAAKRANFNNDLDLNESINVLAIELQTKFKTNKHWWKQIWYIEKTTNIDYICKLETLKDNWPFNFAAPMNLVNSSNRQTVTVDFEKIKTLYKEDVEAFEY